MREWVPVPGSTKAKLLDGALTAFGARSYDAVAVGELAEHAGVTIGSLYHHFGSKPGIYTTVRDDVEQRVLDRMEGAAAVAPTRPGVVLLVGFDYLVDARLARLLAEPHPDRPIDPIEGFLATLTDRDGIPLSRLLAAAWRAALDGAAHALDAGAPVAPVRAALDALTR